jgi:hypothetical protein
MGDSLAFADSRCDQKRPLEDKKGIEEIYQGREIVQHENAKNNNP